MFTSVTAFYDKTLPVEERAENFYNIRVEQGQEHINNYSGELIYISDVLDPKRIPKEVAKVVDAVGSYVKDFWAPVIYVNKIPLNREEPELYVFHFENFFYRELYRPGKMQYTAKPSEEIGEHYLPLLLAKQAMLLAYKQILSDTFPPPSKRVFRGGGKYLLSLKGEEFKIFSRKDRLTPYLSPFERNLVGHIFSVARNYPVGISLQLPLSFRVVLPATLTPIGGMHFGLALATSVYPLDYVNNVIIPKLLSTLEAQLHVVEEALKTENFSGYKHSIFPDSFDDWLRYIVPDMQDRNIHYCLTCGGTMSYPGYGKYGVYCSTKCRETMRKRIPDLSYRHRVEREYQEKIHTGREALSWVWGKHPHAAPRSRGRPKEKA